MEELRFQIIDNLKKLDKKNNKSKNKKKKQYFISPNFTPKLQSQFEQFYPKNEVCKSIKHSDEAKKRGDILYQREHHNFETHFEILHYYNESIAFAPTGSEQLAIVYANRSALLRHIRKYAESIENSDRALKITTSAYLKVKLLCRKAECLTAMGSSENQKCLNKAKFHISKIEDPKNLKGMSKLITKTQSIIDDNKLDTPKEDKKRMEAIRIITDAEKMDIWKSVKMDFSNKHGKYLIAARDFAPGEIIFVEKPYFNRLNDSMIYLYCYHCFEYLWTVVPCDHCAWRLYCSDKCKEEAWNQFHELECSVLIEMKADGVLEGYCLIPHLIGMFCKALKEAGNIDQLRSELKKIDECEDECRKGFSPDGKFDGYRSIYSQPLRREVSWGVHGLHLTSATVALTGLAKHSNIFGRNYSFEETKSLLKNDDATFVGALFLKFLIVIESRLTHIYLFNPINNLEERLKTPERLGAIGGIEASIAIKSLGFLTIFDCAPNAHTSGTYDNKHVMYALHPIKKGTPITTSLCSIYQMYRKKPERQAIYFEFYNRPCECQACKEDWLKDIGPVEKILESDKSKPENIKKLDEEIRLIEIELKKSNSLNFPDTKLLSRAKTAVAKSWKYFPMPSLVTCKAVHLLNLVSDRLLRPWDLDPEKLSLCAN